MAITIWATRHCPRCDNAYTGSGASLEEAAKAAMTQVRDHLVRAQGAEMDDGLHDNALALWDSTAED